MIQLIQTKGIINFTAKIAIKESPCWHNLIDSSESEVDNIAKLICDDI
jgi:hypothetical protein